jgi:hypothetical protein
MPALAFKETSTAPLAPGDEAIDLVHLSRMTLGERTLEREVLALFARQTEILLQRMDAGRPVIAAAAAHTLKGSAVGIGAWRVARAAEAVELASAAKLADSIGALSIAIDEARAAIAALLRAH